MADRTAHEAKGELHPLDDNESSKQTLDERDGTLFLTEVDTSNEDLRSQPQLYKPRDG